MAKQAVLMFLEPSPVKAKLKALQLPGDHERVLARARADLQTKTAIHMEIWHIDQVATWGLDQDEGTLRLTCPQGMVASGRAQIIGSFDSRENTWMWSWANESVARGLRNDAEFLRQYGRLKNLERLTEATWTGTQDECWDMAALAVLLNGAEGAYRGAVGDSGTFLFMTFHNVQLMQSDATPR